MSENSIFTFRIWLKGDEAGFYIGWAWVALIAAAVLWAFS